MTGTVRPISRTRTRLSRVVLGLMCLVLTGCCEVCPNMCGQNASLVAPLGGSAEGSTRAAERLRGLSGGIVRTLRANPALAVRSAGLARHWTPVIDDLRCGDVDGVAVTPEMVAALQELLPDLIAASNETTAARLSELAARLDLDSLVGASSREVLAALLSAVEPPTTITLGARERGLARSGETVLVPAAARVGGAQGTRWRTDLMVVNAADVPATATLALLRRDADNSAPQTVELELEPNEALTFEDVLDSLFVTSGAASLRLTTATGAVSVTSRTYNLLGAGNPLGLPAGSTFGQFVPALSDDDAIPFGDEGRLIQLSHDPGLSEDGRANLILVNGGMSPITAEVDLHDGDGVVIGTVTRQLRAWEYVQIDRIFEEVTPQPVANGYAAVRTTTPGGRLFALASVVDNLTGDPIAVPATLASYQAEVGLAESQTIPAAAHVQGAAGTNWRTDLVLHHLGGPNTLALIDLLRRGQGNPEPEQRQVSIFQGQALRYDDVLVSLFGTDGAAALRVTAYGGPLALSSRTYNLLEAGNPQGLPAGSTFGQYLAPVGWLSSIRPGERALLGHLSHDPGLSEGSRTNLVLVNNATRDADYEVELFRADGTSLGSFTVTLAQWEYGQIDRVFERVTGDTVDAGYAIVRGLSPWSHFHAQASVVDNRTGDPITVDAIPLRVPETAGVVESMNMLFDALEDGSLPMRQALLMLTEQDANALLDAAAAAAPGYVTRTPHGVVINAGLGTLTEGGYIVGGRVELDVADDFSSGSGQASGGFSISFDGFHVDGVAPVLDTIEGSVELQRTDGDHVTGTITLGSPGISPSTLGGNIQVNTLLCELYPIGGSVTITIDGETYTIDFNDLCDGSYTTDVPTDHWQYRMQVRACSGTTLDQWDTIFLVEENGRLTEDPSAPVPFGRGTWSARGTVTYGSAELTFGKTPDSSPDGLGRVGWYRGLRNEPVPGTVYYSGIYFYNVWNPGCLAWYLHSRGDPDFFAAILEPCDGPCTP